MLFKSVKNDGSLSKPGKEKENFDVSVTEIWHILWLCKWNCNIKIIVLNLTDFYLVRHGQDTTYKL